MGDADERGARPLLARPAKQRGSSGALESAERLVEDDETRIGPAEATPEAHALALAARHQRPALAERRLQAVGQLLDYAAKVGSSDARGETAALGAPRTRGCR